MRHRPSRDKNIREFSKSHPNYLEFYLRFKTNCEGCYHFIEKHTPNLHDNHECSYYAKKKKGTKATILNGKLKKLIRFGYENGRVLCKNHREKPSFCLFLFNLMKNENPFLIGVNLNKNQKTLDPYLNSWKRIFL